MAQAMVVRDVAFEAPTMRRADGSLRIVATFSALARGIRERKDLRRSMGTNPASLGRSTGCRV